MSFLRRRKGREEKAAEVSQAEDDSEETEKEHESGKKTTRRKRKEASANRWSCVSNCCWLIGVICSIWWFLLFLLNAMPASFPQYVTEAITGPVSDPPGVKLRKEGLTAKHPVVFVPGIVTGGLELWEGHSCADGLFRKRLWGGTFGELYKRLVLFWF